MTFCQGMPMLWNIAEEKDYVHTEISCSQFLVLINNTSKRSNAQYNTIIFITHLLIKLFVLYLPTLDE